MKLAFESADSVKQFALRNVVAGIIQSIKGLNGTKRGRKEKFDPFCLSA